MSTTCPPLAVFCLERGPINTTQWIAFFVGPKGFLPVYVTGNTEAEVTAKAREFWERESAKATERGVPAARLAALAKARAARSAKTQVAA